MEGIIRIKDERIDFHLDNLFPERSQVFAEWFSGVIRVPNGEMLEYIHAGYCSIYENDLFLKFENGILINYDFSKNIKPSDKTEIESIPKNKYGSKTFIFWNLVKNYIRTLKK